MLIYTITNTRTGAVYGNKIRLLTETQERVKGLLDRDHLEPGEGIWIYPASSIHTVGMRFPIDVLFLKCTTPFTPYFSVIRFVGNVQPGTRGIHHSPKYDPMNDPIRSVIELPAGTVRDIALNDIITCR